MYTVAAISRLPKVSIVFYTNVQCSYGQFYFQNLSPTPTNKQRQSYNRFGQCTEQCTGTTFMAHRVLQSKIFIKSLVLADIHEQTSRFFPVNRNVVKKKRKCWIEALQRQKGDVDSMMHHKQYNAACWACAQFQGSWMKSLLAKKRHYFTA